MKGRPARWLTAVACACSLLAAGGEAGGASSPFPRHGGTLVLASAGPIPYLDPAPASDRASAQVLTLLYSTLLTYQPGTTRLAPALATGWSWGEGGRLLVLDLRRGVEFSNGDPFTAQDVVYTLTRFLRPATNAPFAPLLADVVGAQAVASGRTSVLTGVQAAGPYRVVIHLRSPDNELVYALALPYLSILDAHAPPAPHRVVGTGPYMLSGQTRPGTLVLVRNPRYWQRGYPFIDRVVIHENVPVDKQLAWFAEGRLSMILPSLTPLPRHVFGLIKKQPRLRSLALVQPQMSVFYLGFNVSNPLFAHRPALREALAYAIDKRALVDLLGAGETPANQMLPPGMPGYLPGYDPYPYSPRKAQALLARAGYPGGRGLHLTLTYANSPTWTLVCQAIARQLGRLGIRVTLQPMQWDPFVKATNTQGAVSLYLDTWRADFPDPGDILYHLFASQEIGEYNGDWYRDPEVDRLLAAARTTLDRQASLRAYDQVQRRVVGQAVVIPLYYGSSILLRQPTVQPPPGPTSRWLYLNPALPTQLQRLWLARSR